MTYRPFTSYEEFIYLSRYARWIEDEGRRETWPETIKRVVDAFKRQVNHNTEIPWNEIETALLNREIVPSMRVMMAAGPALDNNHIAAYNCSFLDIDSYTAFSEALYVLMHGTGLGFSVKEESISQLPAVAECTGKKITFKIEDSKEGWRDSVDILCELAPMGYKVYFDYSAIRPEGARLKTFGGRASGPDPLKQLHRHIIDIFSDARGRHLTTVEAHSIVCKIAEVVVVGGVRRSALISLSDLSDDNMAKAKSGEWWIEHGEFALANNSAVYEGKPTEEEWIKEWDTIKASGSGERGIFNLESAFKKCEEIGRKPLVMGTNPCGENLLRDGQFCNLSEVIIRPEDTMETLMDKVRLCAILGTIQSTYDQLKGLRQKWVDNTIEERLLGVSLTGIMDNDLTNGADEGLENRLTELRLEANATNIEFADILGINRSTAVTTVKPSGTVSQLCGVSSGIHPSHANSYIRRVRNDKKDPLTQLMIDEGVPGDTDFYNPNAHVFEFGIKRPNSRTRDDMTALQFLEIWKAYKVFWTDHNPSVTVSIHEDEWRGVGDWVYNNFDIVGGLSFLPHSGGTYQQTPYETSDDLPPEANPDFSRLTEYEMSDNTTSDKQLACSAGVCEI
jgi:ribonucleoside-diphosphate reductase alpha chain